VVRWYAIEPLVVEKSMKILLAVDGSAFSDAAVQAVAVQPWPAESVVKVVSAVKLPFTPTAETRSLPESDYSQIEKARTEQAQAVIAKALAALGERGTPEMKIESATLIGDPREIIVDEATKWEADLVVLGSRGLGGLKRLLLGSVATSVLTDAPCSVQIVRRKNN
jgi:nucleotide-binding universal stress UspA family protein